MHRLANRIKSIGPTQAAGQAAISGGAASPGGTPTTQPVAQLMIVPQGEYSTVAYRDLPVVFAPDGAAVYPGSPAPLQGVRPAGRP